MRRDAPAPKLQRGRTTLLREKGDPQWLDMVMRRWWPLFFVFTLIPPGVSMVHYVVGDYTVSDVP